MMNDIEIAEAAKVKDIREIASRIGLSEDEIQMYGRYMAKVPLASLDKYKDKKDGKLVVVTAITPTPAGEGKTVTTIGLIQGLGKLGKNVVGALREPSIGPTFGIKGGATGGGYSQVYPMWDIDLHFTGDIHAVTAAHNLLSAIIDNELVRDNALNIDPTKVVLKKAMDINARELRNIVTGLGRDRILGGVPHEAGFLITSASEISAILALSEDRADLRRRLENMVVAYTYEGKPVTVKDLKCVGAMMVLLKDAINPNLVQTLEGEPVFVHGFPFANIAHGTNSIIATKAALKLGDYVITEAGFGADLGAEKFDNILCRKSGLQPDLTVIVATAQGLKMHGGVPVDDIRRPNPEGLRHGLANLDKHVANLKAFGQTVVVVFNHFDGDTDEEMAMLRAHCEQTLGVPFVINDAYAHGGEGAVEMARLVADTIERQPSEPLRLTYDDADSIEEKIEKVAKGIYGAARVTFAAPARRRIKQLTELGMGSFPVCIAKTQFSFSADAKQYGAVGGFDFLIRDVVINAGAEMVVAIAGDILRMPGLPKDPQANHIEYANGEITGLS